VHRDVLAQVALDVAFVLDHLTDAVDLVFAEILDLLERVNVRLRQNLRRTRISDAEDVCERDPYLLVAGQIDASNTCHGYSFYCFRLCAPGLKPVRTVWVQKSFQRFIASLDSS
jgi:hypothetical protein